MAISSASNGEFERKLWETAERLRGPVDPSEYKDYTLGLLFLKNMSDSFEERRAELEEKTRDPDSRHYVDGDEEEREYILTDKDEYKRENVFYLPEEARWQYFVDNATNPQIGKKIDDAMRAIEDENPRLKGILPKGYARSSLSNSSSNALEGLINVFADVEMTETDENGDKKQDEDIFGRVYEYFIKQFAMKGGQKGGEFYTPKSVVELMVEILEPYEGRIFDPFSGSGGMFVQNQKFIQEHGGDTDKISIYGQEIKESTLQLSKMNLYLRGLDGNIKQGDSILNDQHKGLEADYIITNPPFNMSEWGKDAIADDDPRFKYGMPPSNNANYAFIQHMIHHLGDSGMAATVMANGAMSAQNSEGEVRKGIIEDDLLDAVIALPKELFYTTPIPACIFVFSKGKASDSYRDRQGETLFIDATALYENVGRTQNQFSEEHIRRIAETVRSYHGNEEVGEYEDHEGFCKIANGEEIQENRYIVTPGRYVGTKSGEKSGEVFEKQMETLSAELREKFSESNKLQEKIENTLQEAGF